MEVNYESRVDERQYTERLHCSPSFHDHPRYDGVLLQTDTGPIFAVLLSIFVCSVLGTEYPLALVLPLDAPTGQRRVKDRELSLHRVRARPLTNRDRSQTCFIPVESVIRGALLAKTFDRDGDYFVVDVTHEGDMLLRLREINPEVCHSWHAISLRYCSED